MKISILFPLLTLWASYAAAQNLQCEIKVNGTTALQSHVQSSAGQKVKVGQVADITAYITEKNQGLYTLEAFLGDSEVRIYGEGILRSAPDHVGASYWSRETLIEISCAL